MDYKLFILSFIEITVWPILFFLIFKKMNPHIINLFKKIIKLKYREVEFEFENDVDVDNESINGTGNCDQILFFEHSLDRSFRVQIKNYIKYHPNIAIILSWSQIEAYIRSYIYSLKLPKEKNPKNIRQFIDTFFKKTDISAENIKEIRSLYRDKIKIVKNNIIVTPEYAETYLEKTEDIVEYIKNITSKK